MKMVDLQASETSNKKSVSKIGKYLDGVSCSPNGNSIAVVSSNLTGRLWNGTVAVYNSDSLPTTNETVPRAFFDNYSGSTCVQWISNDRLVTTTDLGSVDMFSMPDDGTELKMEHSLMEHHDVCSCAAFNSKVNQIVTGSWDKSIKLWDMSVAMSVTTLKGHSDRVLSVAWSDIKPRIILSASQDGRVNIYDNSQAKPAKVLCTFKDAIPTAVGCSTTEPDRISIGQSNGDVSVYDLRSMEEPLFKHNIHSKIVNRTLFCPSSDDYLATCSDDCTISIYNWKDNSSCFNKRCHEDYIRGLDWNTKTNALVSCAWDGIVKTPYLHNKNGTSQQKMDVDS